MSATTSVSTALTSTTADAALGAESSVATIGAQPGRAQAQGNQPLDHGDRAMDMGALSPYLMSSGLPRGGAACPVNAASQSRRVDDGAFEWLVKTFNGYVAPASYYTYDIDNGSVKSGTAGTGGVRAAGPFSWLGIGEEVFAAVDRADKGSYFDLAAKLLDTTPKTMQRLFVIQEVAHKVAWGCAPKIGRQHNELIGDLAMVNAGGRTGLLITLGNAALSKSAGYSQIRSAVGTALSQSFASFGLKVDSGRALAALEKHYLAARGNGAPFGPAVSNAARQLGIKPPQLDRWQSVLYDRVQAVMQARVNAALSR